MDPAQPSAEPAAQAAAPPEAPAVTASEPPAQQAPAVAGDAGAGPSAPPPPPPEEEEEDPLVVAQREQEEREAALAEASGIQAYDDPAMKEFYADMKEVDRENEVNRILGAFKLNPFEALALRFDAAPDDVKRAYRKVSLAVHPDKCTHPRAKDAFEAIGAAQKELLSEEKRQTLDFLLGLAKEEVLTEWRRAAKKDAAAKLAAVLDDGGGGGVEAGWLAAPEFHAAWKARARDVLAKAEWRRRKLTKRVKEEEVRAKEEHKKEKEEAKRKREGDKAWDKGREGRVGSWRDFVAGKKAKKGGPPALGGFKPPKAKPEEAARGAGGGAPRPPPPPGR